MGASEEAAVATGLHTLTCGLAVDHQDVGHLSKLHTGRVLLNFFQEFSKNHLAPTNGKRKRELHERPSLLWSGAHCAEAGEKSFLLLQGNGGYRKKYPQGF